MSKLAYPGRGQGGSKNGAAIDWFDHGIPPEFF
jgi:hypothetical protein